MVMIIADLQAHLSSGILGGGEGKDCESGEHSEYQTGCFCSEGSGAFQTSVKSLSR